MVRHAASRRPPLLRCPDPHRLQPGERLEARIVPGADKLRLNEEVGRRPTVGHRERAAQQRQHGLRVTEQRVDLGTQRHLIGGVATFGEPSDLRTCAGASAVRSLRRAWCRLRTLNTTGEVVERTRGRTGG